MTAIQIWIRSLLRPRVTSVTVKLYEDKREITNFHGYPHHKLLPLLKSMNELWATSENSTCWFEAELYECRGSCFRRSENCLTMEVTCYRNSVSSNEFKTKCDMPGKYRTKMLNKVHRIYPEQIGYTPWPECVEVKFVLVK